MWRSRCPQTKQLQNVNKTRVSAKIDSKLWVLSLTSRPNIILIEFDNATIPFEASETALFPRLVLVFIVVGWKILKEPYKSVRSLGIIIRRKILWIYDNYRRIPLIISSPDFQICFLPDAERLVAFYCTNEVTKNLKYDRNMTEISITCRKMLW